MSTKKSHKSAAISVLSLSEETHQTRETITKKLKAAGLYPPAHHSRQKLLDAIKPALKKDSSIREKKTFEEWRKLKIRNDRDEAMTFPVARGREWLQGVLVSMRSEMEQKLCNEFPALAENSTAESIRPRAKKLYDDLCAKLAVMGDNNAFGL